VQQKSLLINWHKFNIFSRASFMVICNQFGKVISIWLIYIRHVKPGNLTVCTKSRGRYCCTEERSKQSRQCGLLTYPSPAAVSSHLISFVHKPGKVKQNYHWAVNISSANMESTSPWLHRLDSNAVTTKRYFAHLVKIFQSHNFVFSLQ
jgi:hypothetical protein